MEEPIQQPHSSAERKRYFVKEKDGLLGVSDDQGRVILPYIYDEVTGDSSYDGGGIGWSGVCLTKGGFSGYFCNGELIVPCEYQRINTGNQEGRYLELFVERDGRHGLYLIDLLSPRCFEIIPAISKDLCIGERLLAAYYDGFWSIFRRPGAKELEESQQNAYYKKGEFKRITKAYSEPYPLQGTKLLLPMDAAYYGVEWKKVDGIVEEVIERHQNSDYVIRTIYSLHDKQCLWDNMQWRTIVDGCERISSVERLQIDRSDDDRALYIIRKMGKEGVYNAKKSCFVVSTVFDEVVFQPGDWDANESFLAKLNGEDIPISLDGEI